MSAWSGRRQLMPPSHLPAPPGFNRWVLGREGYVLYNANDAYLGQALERYGEYSEREAQVLRRLCRRGSVAIDVGANLGTHTLVLANAAGPAGFIHAYEPQRAVFHALCATLALNGIVNARAHRAVVGAARGWARLPDVDYSRPGNFGAVSATVAARGRRSPG